MGSAQHGLDCVCVLGFALLCLPGLFAFFIDPLAGLGRKMGLDPAPLANAKARAGAAFAESFDRTDRVGWRDHRHAARKPRGVADFRVPDGINAEIGIARRVTIAERNGAGFPATALVATRESAEGVEELMMRIGAPLRRLAPSGDDHARAIRRTALAHGHTRGEVHEAGDGAEHPGAVVDEPDELPHIGLPTQIEHAAQGGMTMVRRADLHEKNPAAEMIDDRLPAIRCPPLDRAIRLPACGDDPIRRVEAQSLDDLRHPSALQRVKMDVAAKLGGPDAQVELPVQVLDEAVDGVVRRAVALVQQRILALNDFTLVVAHRRNPRTVQP